MSDLGPLFDTSPGCGVARDASPTRCAPISEPVCESPGSGAALRDAGMALVDGAESDTWKRAADAAIAQLAASGVEFGGEEVRAIAGSPQRPNSMGARFSAAAKAGLIRYVKHKPSNRPQLHRCKVAVWVGK